MTLQFKTRHGNDVLLRRFDVSLQFHNWQVCPYFCVCKCLLFLFFCLKGCLLCMLQFRISHLNIQGSAYCLGCKGDFTLGLNTYNVRLQHRRFPVVKFAKFLKTFFSIEHLRWLLLNKPRRSLWFIVWRSDTLVI